MTETMQDLLVQEMQDLYDAESSWVEGAAENGESRVQRGTQPGLR